MIKELNNEFKICCRCKRELPKTFDYFRKLSRSKDGFDYACKECRGVEFRNCPTAKEGYKFCIKCGHEFPATLEYFYKHSSHKDGLYDICVGCQRDKMSKYRNQNRDKINEYSRGYMHSNPEKRLQYYHRFKEYHGGEEKFSEYLKTKYREDIEASRKYKKFLYEKNKEKILARHSAYSKSEHGRSVKRIIYERRRSKELPLNNSFTPDDWATCKNYFKGKDGKLTCAYCGKNTVKITMDHIVPVSRGGGLSVDNILPVCKPCNSSKRDKDFDEWYPKQNFYNREREEKILNYLKSMEVENETSCG